MNGHTLSDGREMYQFVTFWAVFNYLLQFPLSNKYQVLRDGHKYLKKMKFLALKMTDFWQLLVAADNC